MLTFGELVSGYLRSIAQRSSYLIYRRLASQFFEGPEWWNKDADQVTKYDLLLLKQSLTQTPAMANKALGLVSQAYNWAGQTIDPATRRPLYEGQNPAYRIKGFSMASRERLMDRREIALLLNSLDFLSPIYQAFFTCRLLTPCRIKELCDMRRDAVDLTTGKWFKAKTKNGKPQWTLIPQQALALLRALPVEGEYFFTMPSGKPMTPDTARKSWGRFREDLRMDDIQLLDFRRTLSSYLYTEIKADDLTAKAVLNHYDSRPVAIYTRLNYDRLAAIIQQYADWMYSLKQEVTHDTLPDPARVPVSAAATPGDSGRSLWQRTV